MNAPLSCISCCALVAFLSAAPASGEITSKRVLAAILLHTPEPEIVPAGMTLKTAEHVARQRGDAGALWGCGDSMQPLYAPGTALVVVRHDFEKLKKGMTVVYLNEHGQRVAHCLVGETRGGYLTQGLNNAAEDAELLTEDNFIGVVVSAYTSTATDFRAATLAKLSPRERRLITKDRTRRSRSDTLVSALSGQTVVGRLTNLD